MPFKSGKPKPGELGYRPGFGTPQYEEYLKKKKKDPSGKTDPYGFAGKLTPLKEKELPKEPTPLEEKQLPPSGKVPDIYRFGEQTFTNREEYYAAQTLAGVGFEGRTGKVTEKAKLAAKEFLAARAKATPGLLTEAERAEIARQKEEARVKAFEEATGITPVIEEAKEKIAEPPSLAPEKGAATEELAKLGFEGMTLISQIPFTDINLFKIQNAIMTKTGGEPLDFDKLKKTKLGKALGLSALGVEAAAIIAAGYFAYPTTAAYLGKTTIGVSVGKLSGFWKGAISAFAVSVGLGKVTDFEGEEIANLRAGIAKVPGMSSTIQSAVQNGAITPEEGMAYERSLLDFANRTERQIQIAGIFNAQFRYNKEFVPIMAEVRDARVNVLERMGGIRSIAARGTPTVNPEGLLYTMMDVDELVGDLPEQTPEMITVTIPKVA